MCHYDYTAINIGFDLRRHSDIKIDLPADTESVIFDYNNSVRTVCGERNVIIDALRNAGYSIKSDN